MSDQVLGTVDMLVTGGVGGGAETGVVGGTVGGAVIGMVTGAVIGVVDGEVCGMELVFVAGCGAVVGDVGVVYAAGAVATIGARAEKAVVDVVLVALRAAGVVNGAKLDTDGRAEWVRLPNANATAPTPSTTVHGTRIAITRRNRRSRGTARGAGATGTGWVISSHELPPGPSDPFSGIHEMYPPNLVEMP